MKLLIVSFAPFISKNNEWYSYGPYVKEMEIWARQVTEIGFCCPVWKEEGKLLISKIPFRIDKHFESKDFNFSGLKNMLPALFYIPYNLFMLFKSMAWANHIHLRCPGNLGLLGCIAQVFFPKKMKTAKYAGNWDWNSRQPLSYRVQQKILRNTFFTRKMQVLVYGSWPDRNINIKPFFTASYSQAEAIPTQPRILDTNAVIKVVYAGNLSSNKNPLLSLQVAERLKTMGLQPEIHFYGDGPERPLMENYIREKSLNKIAFLHGNQDKDTLKKAFMESHFLVFISRSEGWPKAVAEAMFWACVPITTKVSCVPEMLDNGRRGDLIEENLESCIAVIYNYLEHRKPYRETAEAAMQWSRQYTLEAFETEINKLLK